jgi:hypothetical protein
LQQIHRRRVNASRFAPSHLQELHVSWSDPEANQKSKRATENCCSCAGFL